jgi:hypothetical protein
MRFSHIGIIAVMLVVIAVALAGCSGSSTKAPTGTGTPAAGSAPAGTSASGSSGSSASAVSGTDLFGGLSYNWVEYKMSTGSGNEAMTIYYKYNKQTGKCSMRFEGAGASGIPAGMQEMDCSGTGSSGKASSDPNKVSSDAKVSCSPLEESVTVPAGTFSATKCTVTSQGTTSNTWIAKGKFMVKMESSTTDGGSVNMVLNAYG